MADQFEDKGFSAISGSWADVSLYEQGSVGLLIMDRFKADKKAAREAINHLDDTLIQAIIDGLDYFEKCSHIQTIILSSAHRMAFSRGAKIEAILNAGFEKGLQLVVGAQGLVNKIALLSKPVVAAINGLALGGGLETMMACDYRIAANRSTVVFGLPEGSLGVIPGMGGTQNLPRLVGQELGLQLMVKASPDISVEYAHKIGLVDQVVEPNELIEAAFKLCQTHALKKQLKNAISAPVTLDRQQVRDDIKKWLQTCEINVNEGERSAPLAKRLMYFVHEHSRTNEYLNALLLEQETFAFLVATEDAQEGVRALTESRQAQFKGR